ncbi:MULTISPECIES: hypothetical protein [unclassified Anabaena]|uniref:hypothetical protein n=1 Tax=unclassified Anabaena TaxID=2619674 RepID=UPI002B212F8C|nr:hypothetical protein [Anabaena sp. UHCC 0399]MEA5568966.1 hypothetical protein [Anabaena sp. UHCC 0399]
MGRTSKIVIAAILTVAIAGCASEDTQQAVNPIPSATPVAKSPAAAQSFNNPVVSGQQTTKPTGAASNLIQPTNATERIILVSKGRIDPFAQIVGQPVPEMSQTITAKPVPSLPPLPNATKPQKGNTSTNKTTSTQNNLARVAKPPSLTPVLPKVLPQVVPNPTLVSVLPPPAQPDLAKAVMVTGVVIIGKAPQAIIKIPNELTSRYVEAGQRLANGVLVKRIEMNEGSNPIVILEQYGIEVARTVGEVPTGTTPATTNSVSVTTPTSNTDSVGVS